MPLLGKAETDRGKNRKPAELKTGQCEAKTGSMLNRNRACNAKTGMRGKNGPVKAIKDFWIFCFLIGEIYHKFIHVSFAEATAWACLVSLRHQAK